MLPIGARVAVGCALAGWVSLAAGVGHPYWAVVTAASIYQANTTLSWQRAVQRTLGNVLGLAVFFALLPLMHTGHLAMVLLTLGLQVGAEALITRNYWLGSVCVTPMALLLTEFGNHLPARTLISDRLVDTSSARPSACPVACWSPTAGPPTVSSGRWCVSRRPRPRPGCHSVEPGRPRPHRARDRLALCLVELRDAFEVAAGEWWQRALPAEPVTAAERDGHATLALLVGHAGVPAAVGVRSEGAESARTEQRRVRVAEDIVAGVMRQWQQVLPGLDTAPMAVIGRLNRCSALLQQAADAPLRREGLSRPEFDVLGTLRRMDRELTPGRIARDTFASGAAVTKRLRQLESRGLVARRLDDRDRRVSHLSLTEEGLALLDRLFPATGLRSGPAGRNRCRETR